MKPLILTITLFAGVCTVVFAQDKKSAVIGTMIDRPNAILVLNPPDGNQGFLLPQLTTAQRLSIAPSSPQDDGLVVFDLTEKTFYYWSSNTWIKGLGTASKQVLSYDPTNHTLSLSDGGQVDLTPLKEIPSLTGNNGKFLTTDGTTLSWVTVSSIGDITGIIAGQGLTGGATAGDASLSVNTDGTTISVNGSNQLQVTDGAITPQKINSGGNNKILTTDAGGVVRWEDQSVVVDDNQGLTLQAGNVLAIDNGGSANLNALTAGGEVSGTLNNLTVTDGVITNPKLATNAVGTGNIQEGAVVPAKIQPGTNNQVLITNGTTVEWADQSTLTQAVEADGITIGGDGTTTNKLTVLDDAITSSKIAVNAVGARELADNAVDAAAIQAGAVTNTKLAADAVTTTNLVDGTVANADIAANAVTTGKIQDEAVTTAKIEPGANGQVLVTTGSVVTWVNQNSLNPGAFADNITIGGDGTATDKLHVQDDGITASKIAANAVGSSELANDAVDGAAIQTDAVTTTHLADGTVATIDLQDNAVTTNKLLNGAVTNAKIGTDAVTSTNITNGTVANVDIAPDAITTDKIGTDAVTTPDIQNGAVTPGKIQQGTSNQVLVTNPAGTAATWVDQSTLVSNIAVDGSTITGNGTTGNPLAVGNITTANIPNNTIVNADLQDDAVTTTKILNASVTNAKLATDAVASTNIVDGAVATVDLQDNAVTTNKLLNGAVTNAKIGTDAVTSTNIANGTVANVDIAPDAITTDKIGIDAVTTADIQNGAVTPGKIQQGTSNQVLVTNPAGTAATWVDQSTLVPNIAVDGSTITGNGTTGNPLTVGNITTANIPGNTIVNADIQDDAVTTTKLLDASVTNAKLATDAVASGNIIDGTVATADLQDDAVTTIKLLNGAVTNSKLAADAVTTTNIVDGTIADTDINSSAITNPKLAANAVTTDKIAADAITTPDIQDGAVTPGKIQPGTSNQVLVTNPAGTAATWVDQNTLVPNIVVDGATITGNGTAGNPLTVGNITTANIPNNTIVNADIQDDAVTTTKLLDATVTNAKLATDAVGSTNIINGAVSNVDIAADAITTDKIGADAVTTTDIQNGAVTTAKILQGASNQVLVTNPAGTAATWVDQNTLVPNIVVDGATITGNGTAGNPLTVGNITTANIPNSTIVNADLQDDAVTTTKILNAAVTNAKLATDAVASTNIVNGTVANVDIAGDAITTDKLAADAVTSTDILNQAVTPAKVQPGTANQLMATNGTGTSATWIDRTTLPIAGDVTGTLGATTVTKLQGRDVSNAAPANQNTLVWNGTAWTPAPVTVAPVSQFYALDPANFEVLEPSSNTDPTLGLYASNSAFVFARGEARDIIAAVNLPHGATIEAITVYYEYTTLIGLGPITIDFDRKPYAGSGQTISTLTTGLLSIGVQATSMPVPSAPVIDNQNYTYRVHVTFGNILDASSASGATERLYGIRIQYSK